MLFRSHGCIPMLDTSFLIKPDHDLMQPPSHPAFADFDAFRKLVLFLEPQDVLWAVRQQTPQLASRDDSREVFIHGLVSFLLQPRSLLRSRLYRAVNGKQQYAILLVEMCHEGFRLAPSCSVQGRQDTTGRDRRRQVQKA